MFRHIINFKGGNSVASLSMEEEINKMQALNKLRSLIESVC